MVKKFLKVVLLLLLVAVCVGGYLGWSRIKGVRLDLEHVEEMEDPEAALEISQEVLDEIARRKKAGLVEKETENAYAGLRILDPKDIVWNSGKAALIGEKDLVNFLLIDQAQKKGKKRLPADLILVVSYHQKTGKMVLIPIEKDLYVQIPGYQDNKIAAAYQLGGMKLLDQVIEKNLGLSITHNLGVDFEAILGHFQGLQAMPHQSVEEKEACLNAIFEQIQDNTPSQLLNLADQFLSDVVTDLGPLDLLKYVKELLTCGSESIAECPIPAEDASERVLLTVGMEVVLPDLEKNREWLQNKICNE